MPQNRPNLSLLRDMQKYSTRAWVYRPGEGWLFAEMTPEECAEFRSYEYSITIPRMRVRVPCGTADTLYGRRWGWGYDYANSFTRCTMKEVPPLVLNKFQIHQMTGEEPMGYAVYPVEPGSYETWLWADEAKKCQELGCDLTSSWGYGWIKWGVPAEWKAPLQYRERTFIYRLVDPLTQEVFYVGQSSNPQRRFVDHLRDTSDSAKVERIRNLREQGHVPKLIILEEVDGEIALEREEWWVKCYEKQGHPLTNHLSQIRPLQERKKRRRLALQEVDERKERPRLTMHLKQAHIYRQAATLTLEDWADIMAYFDWKCAYCKNNPIEALDYLVPLQQGGGVTATNCLPTCRACKIAKKKLSEADVLAFQAYFEWTSIP